MPGVLPAAVVAVCAHQRPSGRFSLLRKLPAPDHVVIRHQRGGHPFSHRCAEITGMTRNSVRVVNDTHAGASNRNSREDPRHPDRYRLGGGVVADNQSGGSVPWFGVLLFCDPAIEVLDAVHDSAPHPEAVWADT